MANPVWVLSVNLETKTAAFTSGMGEAARSARSSFNEISSGARSAGKEVEKSTFDMRHGLGLVDNVIRGAHAQAMADLVREFQNSAIVMTALPIAATVAGFALVAGIVYEVYNHIHQLRAEAEKAADDMTRMGTATNNAFTGLDDKILQAQIQADNLRNNHLAALHDELVLIDHQSLEELAQQFGIVEKAADAVFKDLKGSWYTFGIGSDGAKHALDQFKVKYDELLSEGKDGEARQFLYGTVQQAQHVLNLMREAINHKHELSTFLYGDYGKHKEAMDALGKYGIKSVTASEVESQEALIKALDAQLAITQKITTAQKIQKDNATLEAHKGAGLPNAPLTPIKRLTNPHLTGNGTAEELTIQGETLRQLSHQQDEAGREAARHTQAMAELNVAAKREEYARLDSLGRVSASELLRQQMELEDMSFTARKVALQKEILTADQSGNDRLNHLRELFDREKELTLQHENEIAAIKDKSAHSQYKSLQQAERQELDTINEGLVQSIMRHQTWGQMITSIENQVVSSVISAALKHIEANAMTKQSDAAAAARKMFNAGMKLPFPANLVAAPTLAAGAYATVMAFQGGTDMVPGVGRGDIVPTMLEPGEGVVPGGVMDGLRKMAASGGMAGGQHHHHHLHYHDNRSIQAFDQHGVRDVLDRHSAEFERHYHEIARKRHA